MTIARTLLLLATASGATANCVPDLDGARCPCIQGWCCSPGAGICEREPPGGCPVAPGLDGFPRSDASSYDEDDVSVRAPSASAITDEEAEGDVAEESASDCSLGLQP